MTSSVRYTSRDLDGLPDTEGIRYEIVDGDLLLSKTPDWHHQFAMGRAYLELENWNDATGAGVALPTPGVVFAEDQDVIPDLVWVSRARLPYVFDDRGHFKVAPELVIEVLSPGRENEIRDRELKRKIYSRQGVLEYWIVDWQLRRVAVYRRQDAALHLVATLQGDDALTSPLLPGFACPVARLWGPTFDA